MLQIAWQGARALQIVHFIDDTDLRNVDTSLIVQQTRGQVATCPHLGGTDLELGMIKLSSKLLFSTDSEGTEGPLLLIHSQM